MHHDLVAERIAAQKKVQVIHLLDELCQHLEVTETQYKAASSSYEAVGAWLAEANSPYLAGAQIYAQGSIALGTAIKPIGRNEFDVDLVCYLPNLNATSDSRTIKALVGDRLKENGTYRGMLEEKKRCWRLNYANEFHLDITPSISNPSCSSGGELVPDKALSKWKPTNPKGYVERFETYAAITPKVQMHMLAFDEARADSAVAPFPSQATTKPLLKRIVQLLKRHRDHSFRDPQRADLAPISIIITTLAGRAYATCAAQRTYTDAFDFLTAVVREMPNFIRTELRGGRPYFIIENETTIGENFADKWNHDTRLAESFFQWHKEALSSIESLLQIEGVDQFAESLSKGFGAKKEQVRDTLAALSNPISTARSNGTLAVAPALGLVSSPVFGAVNVPKNTFFGR